MINLYIALNLTLDTNILVTKNKVSHIPHIEGIWDTFYDFVNSLPYNLLKQSVSKTALLRKLVHFFMIKILFLFKKSIYFTAI